MPKQTYRPMTHPAQEAAVHRAHQETDRTLRSGHQVLDPLCIVPQVEEQYLRMVYSQVVQVEPRVGLCLHTDRLCVSQHLQCMDPLLEPALGNDLLPQVQDNTAKQDFAKSLWLALINS